MFNAVAQRQKEIDKKLGFGKTMSERKELMEELRPNNFRKRLFKDNNVKVSSFMRFIIF